MESNIEVFSGIRLKKSSETFDGPLTLMSERQEERLSPLPKIGEGFGEWSEAPSYEEGVGVDGSTEGLPSEKPVQGVTLLI